LDDFIAYDRKFQKELNSGTVALVLLSVLAGAKEPLYGYQIARHMERNTGDVSMMKQGALYPVLRSLEKSGFLESRVEPSISGPPRRYYWITDAGRSTQKRWMEIWIKTKDFVDDILKGISNE